MNATDKKKMLVVSIAPSTGEALENALNAPLADGCYYFAYLVDLHDGMIHAVYRLRAKPEGETEEALAIVRANPNLTVRRVVELLAAKEIKRTEKWVTQQRRMFA